MVTAHEYIERARTFATANDAAAASRSTRRALLVDPSCSDALAFATRDTTATGDKARAIALSARALAIDPGDADNRIFLATQHSSEGNADTANIILQEGIRRDASDIRLHVLRGIVARDAESLHQDYIRHFRRAVILDPENGNNLFPVVTYCVHGERFDDMAKIALWRAILHRVKREFSALASSLSFVADAFIRVHRHDNGIKWVNRLRSALGNSEDVDMVSLQIGLLYLKAGRYSDSAPFFRNYWVIRTPPTAPIMSRISVL